MKQTEKHRCPWVLNKEDFYIAYHDLEWGVPVHDDNALFEMLILEGAQAGLSFETILKRRAAYRKAFKRFNPRSVAKLTDEELENLLLDSSIIRNRQKVFSARKNAQVFITIQKEFGSFADYLWSFVEWKPIINRPSTTKKIPDQTPISQSLSKDLKKRGMKFVGPTIMYAYMQAVGVVNDHVATCFLAPKL